jgi:hypothetical protein
MKKLLSRNKIGTSFCDNTPLPGPLKKGRFFTSHFLSAGAPEKGHHFSQFHFPSCDKTIMCP